jgi:RNA polymerase sigma factor (sigma-70 family)
MPDTDSIAPLIQGVKDGDEEAVRALWDRFFPQLCAVASRHLAGQRRADVDEEDLALSAFASFCGAAKSNRFPDLDDRQGLWRILSQITRRKAVDLIRYRQGLKRGAGHVGGESALLNRSGLGGLDDLPGEDLTPALSMVLQEEAQRLLSMLRDPQLQQLALLKLQGYTHAEIAERFGCSLSTVDRQLHLIRRKWQ